MTPQEIINVLEVEIKIEQLRIEEIARYGILKNPSSLLKEALTSAISLIKEKKEVMGEREIKETLQEGLDKWFPKERCKERPNALMFYAYAVTTLSGRISKVETPQPEQVPINSIRKNIMDLLAQGKSRAAIASILGIPFSFVQSVIDKSKPPEQLPEEIDKTSFLIYDARGEDFRWRVLLDTLNALIRYVGQKDK